MTTHPVPQCAWVGLEGDAEHEGPCGRVAVGFVQDLEGRRVFTCEEHVYAAKARLPGGMYHHGVLEEDRRAPYAHHAASREYRHNASVVGHME